MADVKWIKLSTGLPDNRKIKQIRTLPDGDTIALMWIFLMCLAGNSNDDGFVFFTKEIPYTDEMLAEEFKMDINTIRLKRCKCLNYELDADWNPNWTACKFFTKDEIEEIQGQMNIFDFVN